MSKKILAIVDDMFFASKIKAVAEAVGADLTLIKSVEALLQKALEVKPDLIVVDLHNQKTEPISLGSLLRADPQLKDIKLLGFFSHVEVELQRRAKEAGFTQVLPRSVFARDLPQIFTEGDIS
jgi:CheY-like chemotaxis protein